MRGGETMNEQRAREGGRKRARRLTKVSFTGARSVYIVMIEWIEAGDLYAQIREGSGGARSLRSRETGFGEGRHQQGDEPGTAREETYAAWSKVSNMPLWAHGYSGAWRPWSAALSALTSGKRGLPYSAEYHAKVPPERSESATAVRVELVAREKADCWC
jgi:hypothetical protein